eukprot:TRINITY_DN22974_c0_g1_i1.p1 TRINITY_DN22974_c0_g1~~TRINITY_DN22974_c0_g1_i1.p1  ORF type:complete len:366 (+),score=94.38 TRINITY_DN22974_c0_g1_i1:27-1124(+)
MTSEKQLHEPEHAVKPCVDDHCEGSEGGEGLTASGSFIRLAPLHVPWERRKQTLAVFLVLALALTCVIVLLGTLFVPLMWPVIALYYVLILYVDTAPTSGGRKINCVRSWSFWRHYADYFPARLHKTADVPADGQYIFAVHPHGIVSAGIWANILLQGRETFDKLFAGVDVRAATLPMNFKIPLWREFVLSLGLIDSSRASISSALSQRKSVLIVPGGAKEALYARPNADYYLTLKHRKGFVRLAMIHGCSLVPMFSFGENEIYGQAANPSGSTLRSVQDWLYKHVGVAFPVLRGRGIFNYDVGLLPYRQEINTVVGAPIPLEKTPNPSTKQIDAAHQRYVDALKELYETHKAAYGNEHRKLIIM